MLRFEKLVLEDFGPYKGHKEIVFPDRPGVMFILGENGRGKTHLLNAFRYALLGKVYGRYEQPMDDVADLCNSEAAAERGHGQFQVRLDFTKDGHSYELARRYGPRSRGSGHGEELLLTKDGSPLNQEAAEAELRRVMPDQIHQFFLFDAELLSKYESLLDENNSTGDELKDAIERILGVPILKNARNDVETVAKEVAARITDASRRDRKTNRLADQLEQLRAVIDEQEANLQELNDFITTKEAELERIEHEMRRTQKNRSILTQRELKKSELSDAEVDLAEAEEALKEAGKEAWRAALRPVLTDVREELDEKALKLRDRFTRMTYEAEIRRRLEDGGDRCPTCDQHLDDEHRHAVMEQLGSHDDERLVRLERAIGNLNSQREQLTDAAGDDGLSERVIAADGAVRKLQVKISDLENDIDELNERLGDASEAELMSLANQHSNLRTLIERKKEERRALVADLEEHRRERDSLVTKLSKESGGSDPSLDRKHDIVSQLKELFAGAIDAYRDKLRNDVESEATKLFLQMRHEPDYTGLRINDQYGLEILYEDGTPVTGRSSGEEQVVALSLVGALQRCAPVQGPIVVDMPFGRLDARHKRKVIATLPDMSDQVVLLAFEDEFDADAAREDLGAHLVAEKELVRVTGRHTDIEDVR